MTVPHRRDSVLAPVVLGSRLDTRQVYLSLLSTVVAGSARTSTLDLYIAVD